MVYIRNEPVATDDLDVSQPKLAGNTNSSDDSFGIDHYKFSDLTTNNGFHNKVTTPAFVDTPPTGLPPVTTTNPVFYSFQQTAPMGVLQYSRGPSNAVPTPLTCLQGPAGGITILPSGGTINIMDFTGIPRIALFEIYYCSDNTTNTVGGRFLYNFIAPNINVKLEGSSSNLVIPQFSGNILQLKDPSLLPFTIFWTLKFLRVE